MAVGDSDDFVRRLRSLIPSGWIAQYSLTGQFSAYVSQAVLGGLADSLSWCYGLLQGAKAATRRLTLVGWLIDLDAVGFFGITFLRRSGESDASFSLRYRKEVFRPRGRRQDIIAALTDLTGRTPTLIEPWNPADTAAYDYSFYDHCIYGTLDLPFQYFITVFRPVSPGIPNIAGYDYGFYDAPTTAYIDLSEVVSPISDVDLYAAVARNTAAGVIPWTQLQ